MSTRPRVTKLRIPGQRASLSDYDSDNDELNKTLPHNFKFGTHLTAPNTMQSPTRSSPIRSMAATTARGSRNTTIQRRQPVAPSSRPSPNRYKHYRERRAHLNKSDPAIARNSLISPEESFEEEATTYHDSLPRRDSLKLPTRAQSLNYPKSPQSPRISSPSPGECPGIGSPRTWSVHNPNFLRFADGRRSDMGDRGRRLSVVSLGSSGYGGGNTDSPMSLSSYPSHEQIHQLPTTPTTADFDVFVRHFRSDSNGSVIVDDEGMPVEVRYRPRARSLSPERSPREILLDLDATHNIFKDKFPRAKEEMEEKLQEFLTKYSESKYESADSTVNFGRHKILECAREVCEKSQNGILTKDSIIQMSTDLELVLQDVKERTVSRPERLEHLVRKLLMIVGRVARLLEIMHFDPDDFSSTINDNSLDKPTRLMFMTSSHMPYILNRLSSSIRETTSSDEPKMREKRTSSVDWKANIGEPPVSKHCKEDFSVIKPISNGAYGAVYLVRHKDSGTRFAMKKISKHRMVMKKQVQQVFYERDILSFAENPFVVGLWCTFQTKSHLYLVMEYVEGGDVATLLKNVGCLPVDLARMYFAETILAIEYIHSYGVIHRDLKPDNLLITSEGHIKLTDFGLSKIGLVNYTAHVIEDAWTRDRQFRDSEVYGTPDYIAPEVILGQGYGFAVDWWSMGVILYEVMIGATPFWSTTVQELFDEITDENLVINWNDAEDDDIPDEGKDIVEQLLCHDPYSRLGSSTRGGADVVKEHPFFDDLDWENLLRRKSEFVPDLTGDDDTSYFDTRSDRYTHDQGSDEEDGPGDADMQREFKNFDSTAPRFSHLLEELHLNFDDPSITEAPQVNPRLALEPKHEKRDSGIAGLDTPDSDTVKILRGGEEKPILQNAESAKDEDDETTDEEEDLVTTHIDEVSGDEDDHLKQPTPTNQSSPHIERHIPDTPQSNKSLDEDDLISPLTSSFNSSSSRRRKARAEDINKLTVNSLLDLDIMVSPPTPGGTLDTSSGSSVMDSFSPINSPRSSMVANPVSIKRGPNGYGITFKAVRVYIGDTHDYRIHHIIETVDKKSSAWDAGIRKDQLITHINGEAITGLQHVQVVALMVDKKHSVISISTIPLEQTSIQKEKRKRIPSLGQRVGKILRHRSSGSGRVLKKPSFLKKLRRDKSGRLDSSGHSSSSTPSPKNPSSPHRSDSLKQRLVNMMGTGERRRKHNTPMSPLARSTSPVGVASGTLSSSPPGSMPNVNSTPPNSPTNPPSRRPERHSMFVDSQLLVHQKSFSVGELGALKRSSPHTSPLLKRAVPKRSITLPREGGKPHHKKPAKSKSVHLSTPERTEEVDEGTTNF